MRTSAFLLTLALFFGGCATSKPAKMSESDWFSSNTSKVYKYELQNGLKLIVLEDHSAPTFAYHTWFSVGSMDEDPNFTGLAHLFEHMMFKATKKHPDGEFDRTLESAGAEGENAFTNRDYTGYVQSMPRYGKRDNLELIAELESDRMINLVVDEEVLNKERDVVQNERRFRNENSPEGKIYERIYEIAFKKHSYHWPVIGYEEHLQRVKAKECYEFYQRYYAPNNATIVIVGDVNHSDALKVVTKYYGSIPSSKIARRKIEKEPTQESERAETMKLKLEVEKLAMGFKVPEGRSEDFATIEILRNVLAGGKSSRLYRKLVDGGIATDVEIDNSEDKEPGIFIVWASMQKGRTSKQAVPIIEHELAEIANGKVTDDELKTAVSLMRFSVIDDLVSNESKARMIGFYETTTGDFANGIRLLNKVKTVNKQDLAKVVKKYFERKNRTMIYALPERGAK